MKYCLSLLALMLCLIFFWGCKKEKGLDKNGTDCSKVNHAYSADIAPVIAANCQSSSCHNAGSPNGDFTSYNGLKAKASNGSLKTRVIDQKNMPPSASLSEGDLEKIECWISSGAKND